MRIDVLWTPSELVEISVRDRVAIVVDVLRAGSSVATALHHGARAIVPAASTEEALRITNSLGRDQAILCGERDGKRIDGFDLGNSPSEFTPSAVGDRTIVMTTTNGTRALMSVLGARVAYMGALVNLDAVAERLQEADGDPLIVCAGRKGRVSIEDALCAGMLVKTYLQRRGSTDLELGDGAVAALALARQHAPVTSGFLRNAAGGRALEAVGHGEDIELCARVDSVPEVPVFSSRQITSLRVAKRPRPTAEVRTR